MNTLQRLQEILSPDNRKHKDGFSLELVPKVVCKDGFSVSVQASQYHYCEPRNDEGNWSRVELGYPSETVPEWLEYAEDADKPTDTVYGYVPFLVVVDVLESHGGIV